jgi:hypothetical protein
MRCVGIVALCAALFVSVAAQAEKRMFVIANDADDYGVDRCLISGSGCGTTVANGYCHSHEYTQAVSFRKVERDENAGAISASDAGACAGNRCRSFVAIECLR